MHAHTVTYVPHFSDDGSSVTKKLYFNLSLAQLQDMIHIEGWDQKLTWMGEGFDMANLDHRRTLLNMWKDLIHRSYGIREGDSFRQSTELSDEFMNSQPYDALLEDIFFTEESRVATKFLNGLFPPKIMEQMRKTPPKGEAEVSEIESRINRGN